MKKLIYPILILSILLCSCKQKYEVVLPMSDIFLYQPEDNKSMDLNDHTKDEYIFSWNKISEGGNTLILSASPVLLNPVTIDLGDVLSYEMKATSADQYFSTLGVESGKNGRIYWSVKPTKNQTVAASDIRILNVKRILSKLESPTDQFAQVLDTEKSSETLRFSWNTDGMPEAASYSICFGTNADLTGDVAVISAGAVKSVYVTQMQLQEVLEKLPLKKYESVKVYWNIINDADNSKLSRSPFVLQLEGMLIFKDTRGDEVITYRVVKLDIDGTSQVWLAENLRATKYPDGTDIEAENIKWAPASMGENYVKVYGAYYNDAIKLNVVPKGWKLPSVDDYKELFGITATAEGQWNVLKDPVYYEIFFNQININAWGLSLVTAGQWVGDNIVSQKQKYCYLLASDTNTNECVLHDGGATLWFPWTTGAPIRMYYTGE